jgi:phosphatidylinositol alpha-1,6-mannosyltransferase
VTRARARLLLIASEFPPGPGGIGTHAHQVAVQLAARHWDVQVLASQDHVDEARIAPYNAALPFPLHRFRRLDSAPPVKAAYRFARSAELLRHWRPDVIVASGERMVWIGAGLSRSHRLPMVAVGHAMEFNVPRRWNRFLNRAAFQSAAGLVCVSQYTWKQMERMGIRPARGAVIPNGADAERFHPVPDDEGRAFRRERGLGDGPLLLTLGGVHERKGQDVVIRALPRVLARHPDARYVSCGLPVQREKFEGIARELGVAERVHFLGVVPDRELLRAINAADLFVMASQHTPNGDFEGYGIAAVEAALCGRAAVVSDNSGLVEAIEPGVTGLAARISDPASLAEQILRLLGDRELLRKMGAAARTRALAEQTWARRGDAYDAFLRSVIEAQRREPIAA